MNDIIDTPLPRDTAAEEREAQAALENAANQNSKLSDRFADQLVATRESLCQLDLVASVYPELFEYGSLIEVTPKYSRVYIHASNDRNRDWKSFARKYPANWRRQSSASDCSYWDYDGNIDGVEIMILQAEKLAE